MRAIPMLPAAFQESVIRQAALMVAATGLLALSAKVQVPLLVPMTLQTLVVLVLGAAFGARLAVATMLLYLAEGALGMPVFAGPVAGTLYFAGPTGGYLVGFVLAALVVGLLSERGLCRTIPGALSAMIIGHAVIFACGFAWLSVLFGAQKAFAVGVAPFYAATAIKTALGAAFLPAAFALMRRFERG